MIRRSSVRRAPHSLATCERGIVRVGAAFYGILDGPFSFDRIQSSIVCNTLYWCDVGFLHFGSDIIFFSI